MNVGKILYHTVEDRNNLEYVRSHAPFLCNRKDAWLGSGYYFWEYFVDFAHWWGEQCYNGNYYICETSYIEDQSTILDLHGDMMQLADFLEGFDMLCKELGRDDFLLPEVIAFMRRKPSGFNFKAIRVSSIKSRLNEREIGFNYLPMSRYGDDFMSLMPRIQMCVFDKKSVQMPVAIII